MKNFLKVIVENEMVRYLFWGACTTMTNLSVFLILHYGIGMELQWANLISILSAIVFAFFVNKYFVFRTKETNTKSVLTEFFSFTGMRVVSLLVEMWGVGAMCECMHLPGWLSKLCIQMIVIALNYIFSKCCVFKVQSI